MTEWITSCKSGTPPNRMIYVHVGLEPRPIIDMQHRNVETFRLATAVYVRKERNQLKDLQTRRFDSPEALWTWIAKMAKPRTLTWIVMHDAGAGLISCWWQWFLGNMYELEFIVDADPPVIVRQQMANGARVAIVDLRNYINASLELISELVDAPIGEHPGLGAPDESQWQYSEHCCRVVRMAFERVCKFHVEHDIGPWTYTLSGMSLTSWRHRFGPMPINKKRPEHVQTLERQCYWSCPVEVYFYGRYNSPCYLVDVVSMFPFVMRNNRYPKEIHSYGYGIGSFTDRFGVAAGNVAATVLVSSTRRTFPVRLADGTYWCTGTFWTSLCGPELQEAWQHGEIKDMAEWSVYRMVPMFEEYVDYWYPLKAKAREDRDRLSEHMAKQLLVSLHGKLAQRHGKWIDVERGPDDPQWGRWREYLHDENRLCDFRSIAGKVQYESEKTESRYSFTAISAWVASYARQYMRYLLREVGPRDVLYLVADGAILTEGGYRMLFTGRQESVGGLGQLELRSYSESCEIRTHGHYTIGQITRHAGYVAPGFVRDREVTSEDVRQRMPEAMAMGPAVGLIKYGRTRKAFASNRRVMQGDMGWTRAPHLIGESDVYKRMAQGKTKGVRYGE